MVVDEADFRGVQTYGQLMLSHKIVLLPLNDVEQKQKLIEETIHKKYTVKQLKDRIAEQKTKGGRSLSLNRVISKPDLLFSPDYSSHIDVKSLARLSATTISKLRTKALKQKKRIENEIVTQRTQVERYSELIQLFDAAKKQKSSGN